MNGIISPWEQNWNLGQNITWSAKELHCYGHATVDLSLGEQTYLVDIIVVGTPTTRAVLGIDFHMRYNEIVDVGMA